MMQERKRIIIDLLSGILTILIVGSVIYLFNTESYKCTTIDDEIVKVDEIIEKGNSLFAKQKDGTVTQIKSYKEVHKVNFIFLLFVGICLYILFFYIIYTRLISMM